MADIDNITPSRRGVVLYGASFISAATLAMPVADRAFAAIDDHRQKRGVFEAFCDAHEEPADHEDYDMVSDAETEAWEALCECEPETVSGAAAMASYIAMQSKRLGYYDEGQSTAIEALANALGRLA